MLSYAYQTLQAKGYRKLATEEFHNTADLCAAILAKGVATQIKRGLRYEYVETQSDLQTLRGRIDLAETIRTSGLWKKRPVCVYDEFSVNSYPNRIVKTTLLSLLRAPISQSRRRELRRLLEFLKDVEPLEPRAIDWKVRFDRNSGAYRMIVGICYLTLNGLLQTTTSGEKRLMDFLDEQAESRLYEKFILEYYRKERPQYNANAPHIKWALDDGYDDALPIMKSDVTLSACGKTLIIDAKYYASPFQSHYDARKLHSANIYQIFTYVKNKTAESGVDPSRVAGLLLYAKPDDAPDFAHEYRMYGSRIGARTLDLNRDFAEIAAQLNRIADNFFEDA